MAGRSDAFSQQTLRSKRWLSAFSADVASWKTSLWHTSFSYQFQSPLLLLLLPKHGFSCLTLSLHCCSLLMKSMFASTSLLRPAEAGTGPPRGFSILLFLAVPLSTYLGSQFHLYFPAWLHSPQIKVYFNSSNVHEPGSFFSYVNPKDKPYLLWCNLKYPLYSI